MNETYEDAVLKTVMWWSEKAFQTPLNQNNGDDSPSGGMAFMLMNMVANKAQTEITLDQIKNFEDKLFEILMADKFNLGNRAQCEVDYHPNKHLHEACEFAKINSSCLPCKTFTYIDVNNVVNGRYQYGGNWFKL